MQQFRFRQVWPLCCALRRQFRLLLQRSWRQISRDKAASMARLMSNLSSAVIFGAIFFRMQVRTLGRTRLL